MNYKFNSPPWQWSKPKWLWTSLFIISIISLIIISNTQSLAQDGDQPEFTTATYSSGTGDSVISSSETTLTGDYFSNQGTLDNLEASSAGLTLVAGATSGAYVSEPVSGPGLSTDIVPLWSANTPDGTEVKVETRLSIAGGPYSDWVENPEAFFPVRNNEHAGNLIWVGGEQAALQVRLTLSSNQAGVSPSFNSLTLVYNDTSNGPTDIAIASQMPSVSYAANTCPVPKPNIVSRTAWGSPDGQGSRAPVQYQSVTHVVIHHTATSNNLSQNYASMVRTIWNYHALVLGWGDIGYNYLIDPNGVIYEGRAGGDDAIGVRGINRGPNAGAMAVGFIGCYGNCNYLGLSNAQPSQAMIDSGVELMSWKLGQKNIDAQSNGPIGGFSNIPVIAGGRDVSNTLSPGDNLYSLLPTFRNRASDRLNCPQACQMTDIIFDKSSYNVNDRINVTVRLADQANNPLDGADLRVDVDRPEAGITAANVIDLISDAGRYEGSYSNTDLPGSYVFRFSATDPAGNRFTPCYGEATVNVQGAVATPTPSVTATPTPTPTPLPPEVLVEPTDLEAFLCESFEHSTAITIKNAPRLGKVSLTVSYDPSIVQVRDADPDTLGVQVRPNDAFIQSPSTLIRNEVNTDIGRVTFEAELKGSNVIEGDDTLIVIDWFPQSVGTTQVTIDSLSITDANGRPLNLLPSSGTVTVKPGCPPISGAVMLQGRTDHSGIVVTSADGEQATTDAGGNFIIEGSEPLSFSYPGYLSAKADPGTAQPVSASADGQVDTASVGQITLLAGDMNQDNVVDIFDLAYLASNMDTTDTLSDLNSDGQVNILDLVLVASNYRAEGPLTSWE